MTARSAQNVGYFERLYGSFERLYGSFESTEALF